jgi:hypothetical protein
MVPDGSAYRPRQKTDSAQPSMASSTTMSRSLPMTSSCNSLNVSQYAALAASQRECCAGRIRQPWSRQRFLITFVSIGFVVVTGQEPPTWSEKAGAYCRVDARFRLVYTASTNISVVHGPEVAP